MIGVEADPGAEVEGHHDDMRLHRLQHLDTLNHPIVQLQQFFKAQTVDVNGHVQGLSVMGWQRSALSKLGV